MLNWQIGKKYRRRNGEIATMSHRNVYPDCAIINFINDDFPVYEDSGRNWKHKEDPRDIIEEVKEDEMKIEVGKYYKTRSGHKAFVGGELNNLRYYGHIGERIREWDNHGVLYGHGNELDLIEEWKEPKSGVVYMNVYIDGKTPWNTSYLTRKDADNAADQTRLACVRIEWKEGQFDD